MASASGGSVNGFARTAPWPLLFFAALTIRSIFLFIAPNNTTDAWSRYLNAALWLQHPTQLPPATSTAAWLPLHFWMLGAVLWVTKSPFATRVLSVVLGSLTVVFFTASMTRVFGRRTAMASAALLILFGFHLAFSVTTSSETPTIFFVVMGLYAWVRYTSQRTWEWLTLSTLAFSAASLCRFEAWLFAPVLSVMLLDFSRGWKSASSNRQALWQALTFGLLSSAGALGWLLFSYLKWGDPLHLPHLTMWLNLHFQPAHHSPLFRLLAVPGALVLSLSPLILALAALGLVRVVTQGSASARAVALLFCVLCAFNVWNAVKYEVTQARYTLLYSWLLFPLAFEGVRWISSRWNWPEANIVRGVIIFFLAWQIGIIAGSRYAPPAIADKLGVLSPTVPLRREMRDLTEWLRGNESRYHTLVVDDYNWESTEIFRFAHLRPAVAFWITQEDYDHPELLRTRLENFVQARHPELLVCSPDGPICKLLAVDIAHSFQGVRFRLESQWRGDHWRVYSVTYM